MTRLRANQRNILVDRAMSMTVFPDLQAAESQAFDALRGAIVEMVAGLATEEERVVLRKFGAAAMVDEVYIRTPEEEGDWGRRWRTAFCLCPRDVAAAPRRRNCHRDACPEDQRIEVPGHGPRGAFILDEQQSDEVWPLFEAWNEAVRAHDEARDAAWRDFRVLFGSCRTIEQVIAKWPPAAEILGFDAPPTAAEALERINALTLRRKGAA